MGRPAPADDLIARFEREGIPGVLCKLSSTPGRIDRSVSLLGQHNREVYGRYLGLSEEELARLREE